MRSLAFLAFLLLAVPLIIPAQDEEYVPPPPVIRGIPTPTPVPDKSTLRARVFYEDTGRPVRRVSVMLMASSTSGREIAGLTDGEGNLEINNVPAGKYYAIVNAPGVVSPLAYIDIRKAKPDNLDEQFAGFPSISVNGMTDAVAQIPARRGGAISGRITYADGDAAIAVRVEILRKVGDEFLSTFPNFSVLGAMFTGGAGVFQTDDRGEYRFSGLPAGEYIVKVTENVSHTKSRKPERGFEAMFFGNSESMVSVFFDNVFVKDKAQTLNVQFGQEVGNVNLTIPDRALRNVTGKVVAAKDKLPIRNAKVTIKRDGDVETGRSEIYGPYGNQGARSDGKGEWILKELPAGKYTVTVEADGSEFDEKDRAYGRDPDKPVDYSSAANMAMSAAMNAVAYANRPSAPSKPPAPKFAKSSKEIIIDENDVAEQVIELDFGATLMGTVTMEKVKPDYVTVQLLSTSEKGVQGSSTSVGFYDYGTPKTAGPKVNEFKLESIPAGKSYIVIVCGDDDYYVKSAESNQVDLLKGPVELKDGQVLANVRVVLSNETGTLKGTLLDAEKQPMPGVSLTFVPTDPAKFKSSSYYRDTRTDINGEFEVKLPPFEYALVSIPDKPGSRFQTEDFYKWLAEAVKQAQTFKIESGQTTKVVIKPPAKEKP